MTKKTDNNLKRQIEFFRSFLEKDAYYSNISRLFFLSKATEKYSVSDVRQFWKNFVGLRGKKELLENINFYIHIPFCNSRCGYCSFPSDELRELKRVSQYVDFLVDTIKYFQKTFSKTKFRNLYIGGGTPNILSSYQMEKLLSSLFGRFNFLENSEERIRTCEFNASVGDLSKLEILKKYDFDRVSFGVQSFSRKTLTIAGRGYQTYEQVAAAVTMAKKLGFKIINTDLIVGLPGDTPKTFAESFSKLIDLEPTTIICYGLYPPDSQYVKKHFKMNYQEYFKKHYPKTMPIFMREAFKIAEKKGYTSKPFDLAKFHWQFSDPVYSKIMKAREGFGKAYGGEFSACSPSSTFGMGPFSRSHVYGELEYQQAGSFDDFSETKKIFSGRDLTSADEMLNFVISSFEQGTKIFHQDFLRIFGKRLEDVFPFALQSLRKMKKIRKEKKYFRIKPQDAEDKYIAALFFVYESAIKRKMKNHEKRP
ncbi:MAG: radical SAM protein [Parcubacteria group bacterium]